MLLIIIARDWPLERLLCQHECEIDSALGAFREFDAEKLANNVLYEQRRVNTLFAKMNRHQEFIPANTNHQTN